MLDWVKDEDHLEKLQREHQEYLVLLFWGTFSDAAQRALREVEKFAREQKDISVFVVDVQKLKGMHKRFSVERVPTVVVIENGEVSKSVEGVQSAGFYAVHLGGAASTRRDQGGAAPRRVVVYSGPGCPACGQLKTYLRQHGVAYRDVDISRDPRVAERLARRSGMMAVPQTEVNGRLITGFDKAKLNNALGIQSEGGVS
jgi:glutaredoxin-like YruB-family protein